MWALTLTVAGLLTSLAASAFLHQQFLVAEVLVCLAAALGTTLVARTLWADLPSFVTSWLDAGTLVVALLIAIPTTLFARPLPYSLLVWPRAAGLLLAAGVLGIAIAGLVSTHRRLEILVRSQTRQLADAQRAASESRLAALSAQVNPHFLFNTLNTLAEVVHEDEDRAEDLITDLASMMRYSLDHSSRKVTMHEEFDVVRRLLRIEQARLQERLQTVLHLDPTVAEAKIPGFLVQPLVENAVRHGIAPLTKGGTVEVRAEAVHGRLQITVRDDGPGLGAAREPTDDENAHAGGLHNVRERLRLTWGDRASLQVLEGPGTHLLLDLPLETA